MRRLLLPGAALLLAAAAPAYTLPPAPESLPPGPNEVLTRATCSVCHSLDYITTQPRDLPDAKAFWSTEVTKMRKLYGAAIPDSAVPLIVEYLASTAAH